MVEQVMHDGFFFGNAIENFIETVIGYFVAIKIIKFCGEAAHVCLFSNIPAIGDHQ